MEAVGKMAKLSTSLCFALSRARKHSSTNSQNRIRRHNFQLQSFTCQSLAWKKRGLPWKIAHVLCCPVKLSVLSNLLCKQRKAEQWIDLPSSLVGEPRWMPGASFFSTLSKFNALMTDTFSTCWVTFGVAIIRWTLTWTAGPLMWHAYMWSLCVCTCAWGASVYSLMQSIFCQVCTEFWLQRNLGAGLACKDHPSMRWPRLTVLTLAFERECSHSALLISAKTRWKKKEKNMLWSLCFRPKGRERAG